MIVVDTSALLAILLSEPSAEDCLTALSHGGELLISAPTLTEALIVADRRGIGSDMARFVEGLRIDVVALGPHEARLAAEAHSRWGKGVHPASLNYGDCFAYALAKERNCPLLFVGNDFSQTDVKQALRRE